MLIKWLTGLIKNENKRKKVETEIEQLKKSLIEDPKFRDEILRELEYRTGRRDILKIGVLSLLGLSAVSSEVYAQNVTSNMSIDENVIREIVSDYVRDYAGSIKIPKPCTVVVAQDGTGDYDVSPGEDASEVIQKAIDYAHSKGGGEVKIREGEYLVEKTINIGPNMRVCGVGQGTKLKGESSRILKIKSVHYNPTGFASVSDLLIEGNCSNTGIYIVDSYGVSVERLVLLGLHTAIHIMGENGWCEGTRIRNVFVGNAYGCGVLIGSEKRKSKCLQGTLLDHVAINLYNEHAKGIAIVGSGGNLTFIDTQIWLHNNYEIGVYINECCHSIFGNIRIENFKSQPMEVYAIYLDKNADIKGSFINLNATGPGQFTEIIRDNSKSGRYIIIRNDVWYTDLGKAWQLRLCSTKAKKTLNIGWYNDRESFEIVTYDNETKTWNPEKYPLVFRCPTKFIKKLVVPTSKPLNPEIGAIYFDKDGRKLYIFDGSSWRQIILK